VGTGPGWATLRMSVRGDMVNGHGTAHGGYLFLLADSAFACACNSHGPVTVAAGADIDFVRPAHEGDVLTATARERTRLGRGGVYDVTITRGTTCWPSSGGAAAPSGPERARTRRRGAGPSSCRTYLRRGPDRRRDPDLRPLRDAVDRHRERGRAPPQRRQRPGGRVERRRVATVRLVRSPMCTFGEPVQSALIGKPTGTSLVPG